MDGCLILRKIPEKGTKRGEKFVVDNRNRHSQNVKKKMTCHKVTNLRTEA